TEQRRDRGASRARLRDRWPSPAVERLCMAQPLARRRPRTDLLRRARSSSPWSDRHAGAANRSPVAEDDYRRAVAVENGREDGMKLQRRLTARLGFGAMVVAVVFVGVGGQFIAWVE